MWRIRTAWRGCGTNDRSVDLNRNCLGPGKEYTGAPDGYDALNAFLNPPSAPSREAFLLHAAWLILRHGMPALKQTIAGGQYVNPKGLFFGGTSLQEETSRLKRARAAAIGGRHPSSER